MRSLILLASAAIVSHAAWGANKCTSASGKVTYQDAPCVGASTAAAVEIQPSQRDLEQRAKDQWQFSKVRDSMTGKITCIAVSPTVAETLGPGYRNTAYLTLQLAVDADTSAAIFTVRTKQEYSSVIFHNNLSGLGAKIGPSTFLPLTKKLGQHVLAFDKALPPELLQELASAKESRLRVRFWPYDQIHDTLPISMSGSKQAILQALRCAPGQ